MLKDSSRISGEKSFFFQSGLVKDIKYAKKVKQITIEKKTDPETLKKK